MNLLELYKISKISFKKKNIPIMQLPMGEKVNSMLVKAISLVVKINFKRIRSSTGNPNSLKQLLIGPSVMAGLHLSKLIRTYKFHKFYSITLCLLVYFYFPVL